MIAFNDGSVESVSSLDSAAARLRPCLRARCTRNSSQQVVAVQQPTPGQTIYVIEPANPQVVYVPQYNPTVVLSSPHRTSVATPSLISFGAGIAIGALITQ